MVVLVGKEEFIEDEGEKRREVYILVLWGYEARRGREDAYKSTFPGLSNAHIYLLCFCFYFEWQCSRSLGTYIFGIEHDITPASLTFRKTLNCSIGIEGRLRSYRDVF